MRPKMEQVASCMFMHYHEAHSLINFVSDSIIMSANVMERVKQLKTDKKTQEKL